MNFTLRRGYLVFDKFSKIHQNATNKLIIILNRAKKLKSIKEDSEADLREFREIQER